MFEKSIVIRGGWKEKTRSAKKDVEKSSGGGAYESWFEERRRLTSCEMERRSEKNVLQEWV